MYDILKIISIINILGSIIILLIYFQVCIDTQTSNPSDPNCIPNNANEWMCNPINNNEQMSGNFLTNCPKTCYDKGFDHGQCGNQTENGKTIRSKIDLIFHLSFMFIRLIS